MLGYLIPWLLVWIFLVAFVPSFRAAHPGPELLKTLSTLWDIAISAFAMITLGFAVAEHLKVPEKLSGNWNPRKLPAVKDVRRIPRFSSIADIVAGVVFLGWWLGLAKLPAIHVPDSGIIPWFPGPLWQSFHGGFLVPVALLTAIGILTDAVKPARPVWTRLRFGIRAAADAIMAVIVAVVLAPRWQDILAGLAAWRNSRSAAAPAATFGMAGVHRLHHASCRWAILSRGLPRTRPPDHPLEGCAKKRIGFAGPLPADLASTLYSAGTAAGERANVLQGRHGRVAGVGRE